MLSRIVGNKVQLRETKCLEYGQIALFRNVGSKLPLIPKIHMKLANKISPIISKILPLSANIT